MIDVIPVNFSWFDGAVAASALEALDAIRKNFFASVYFGCCKANPELADRIARIICERKVNGSAGNV